MQEFGIPPLKLQQAMQLVSMYIRYSVTHTHLPAAHLYHLRRALMCALSQPQNSVESPIKEACHELRLPETYLDHPPYPPQCEPKSEIKASPTPLGSNPRSTTYDTSSSAPQSQHMLARSTRPSPQSSCKGFLEAVPMSSAAKEEVQTTQATSCLCLPIQEEVSQSTSCLRLPILSLSILRRDLFVSAALLLSGVRGAWRGGRFMLAYG